MPHYIKKQVVVEAIKWTGRNLQEIQEFVGQQLHVEPFSLSAYEVGMGPPSFTVTIPTLEGDHLALPGDYIIKGIKGEFYPCKPDIFALTYDEFEKTSVEDNINNLIKSKGADTNKISDGYHTFGELYEHRIRLFIALCKLVYVGNKYAWRSLKHDDGSSYDGWFVLGITNNGTKPKENISYHLPIRFWDECAFAPTLERAEYDGHTSDDVLERLKNWF